MSDIFAEATVKISPSLTGFITDLNTELGKAMKKVKSPVIRVKPGLTRDFVGDLRRQINTAVAQAQRGVKPVVIKTVLQTPSRRALSELVSAPVSLGAVGHITPAVGPAGGASAAEQETINRLLKGNVQLLGLTEVAEEKVTQARRRGSVATKTKESQEARLKRTTASALELEKRLSAIEFEAATATGELAQAKKRLSIANEVEKKASALRAEQVSKETIRVQQLARAEQQLALDRVKNLESAAAARGTAAAGAGSGAASAARRAADRGFETLSRSVIASREADAALTKLGKDTKDLAAAQELLRDRTKIVTSATRADEQAQKGHSAALRLAARAHLENAKAALADSKAQVTNLEAAAKAQRELDKQALASQRRLESARRASAAAAAKSASAEKRRSEQLSRGGQASLLSLAGIRGATLAASRSFLVGAAAITVFARAVKQFADLERNIDVFRATTSATAEQMEQVRKEATLLGADLTLPSVAAGDAAGAMVELAKAGLSVQDSIDGARGVLELSTAAAIDNADAVRLVANVLNAFSLSGKEASTVADVLANAANAAQGSIADIGTAFQQAATAGHQVGLSFQDTATFLTILAKNGIRGSDAGTSLRTALIRLVNPSEKAKKAFEDLGIVLRDARGNIRPDVFLQIASATQKLGPAARDATIALIGGQDAFRAVTILGRQSVKSFLDMRAALRQQGTAAELAKARTEGLHGAMDGLQSVLETVGTTAAGHVGPALAGFVRTVSSGITALSENKQVATTLNQSLQATAQSFSLLGDAIQGVAVVALPLAGLMTNVATSIGVRNILAGVVAYKALNAVLDGAILRLKILRPLFAVVATARIGAALSTGLTTAQIALANFNKERGAVEGAKLTGFQRLVQVEKELAVTTAASATRASTLSVALRGVGAAALAAATGPVALVAGIAALTAGFVFLITRETAAARALRHFREETEKLAEATDRLKLSREGANAAQRAVTQGRGGIEQAQINLLNAQEALRETPGATGAERRQLLLNVAVATQDVTFATQDYKKALDDLAVAQQEQRSAEDANRRERRKAKESLDDLIGRVQVFGRAATFSTTRNDLRGLTQEQAARLALIRTIREQAQADSQSTNTAVQASAVRARLIAVLVEKTKIPLEDLQERLGKIFTAENLDVALRQAARIFGIKGKEAIDAFVKAVEDGISGGKTIAGAIRDALKEGDDPSFQAGKDWSHKVSDGFIFGTGEWKNTIGAAAVAAINDINGIIATAVAQGLSTAQQLAIAQQHLGPAQRRFDRLNKATKGGTVFASDQQKKNFEAARDELNATNAEIDRLNGDIASAQKDTQQKIVDAQKERDSKGQAIVDSLLEGRRATLLQRKITSAGLTAWLGDDLKTNTVWLNYLKNLKKVLLARLKAVGASKQVIHDAMQAISNLIFSTTNEIKRINSDIEKNAKDRQDALNDVLFQKIDLRIRIAQAREDVAAEIRLRRQKLALLTKELVKLKNAGKKNTVAWLELKAQQAEEIAAINDLTQQQKDRQNAFGALSFQFLQTQSGFAANLLGNLIPMGATGGLVSNGGGPTSFGGPGPTTPGKIPFGGVSKNLDQTAKISSATGGPTRGGQSNTNHLLQQILRVLLAMNRGDGHPEAHHRRGQQRVETSYLETHH